MKKKLNIDEIQNELRGNSAFFPGYKKEESSMEVEGDIKQTLAESESSQQSQIDGDRPTGRPGDEFNNRPPDRATGGKGMLVRRGFEYREDQLRALKNLSLKEQMEGKPGSMSQMMRDALDDYLKKRAAEK
jgi:hypothetical protein